MTSTVGVRTDLTELADRLRTAAQALKHPSAHHTLSSEKRAALAKREPSFGEAGIFGELAHE